MSTLTEPEIEAQEERSADLYRIVWRVKATGYEGHGERIFTREDAERFADQMNRAYPDIHHWPQSV